MDGLPSSAHLIMGSPAEALRQFGRPDVLHDNGIWLGHHHKLAAIASLKHIPRIVSLRGMLEPWALKHKWSKKQLAWYAYQRRDLRRAKLHHASAEKEAANLEGLRLGVPIRVIPNGMEVAPEKRRTQGNGRNSRVALFLGRIHPVKGLPMLVEAWKRVNPVGWNLRINGPDEAGHREQVEKAIRATGAEDCISVGEALFGQAKEAALLEADLFLAPSFSESFGMTIAEALGHGLPVLTTTGTPWSVLQERGCGWCVEPSVEGIAQGLREATSAEIETLVEMGCNGRHLVQSEFGWDRVARQFLTTYEELLAHPSH